MESTAVKRTVVIGLLLGVTMMLIQFVPVEQSNPPVTGDIAAPPAIDAILKRACYDCHSNLTRWRWYSHVAPFSWLIARHVGLARKEVNFSEWATYYPQTRRRKLEWIGRALNDEAMPPWEYRLVHPGARLSSRDRLMLRKWVQSSLIQETRQHLN
ncbi:MAG: heme-binding domain-containing protein [Candidatus Binataceae bacterium]